MTRYKIAGARAESILEPGESHESNPRNRPTCPDRAFVPAG